MKQKNRITRSLCAVMLLFCCLLSLNGAAQGASESTEAEQDVYRIDIEFGNQSFYYDYGIWDPNTMRYVADAGSTYPSDGTDDGFPGWYGFDGIANRISVTNNGTNGKPVTVGLTYRALVEDELSGAGVSDVVSGVTMTVTGWTDNQVTVVADGTAVLGFIQLHGEPTVGTERYSSSVMSPIGMLTIKIENWD